MNGLLALSFGFGASWIAFRTSDFVAADNQRGALLGTPDFRDYCRNQHGDRAEAMHTRTDAHGWHCAYSINGRFRLVEIDVDRACQVLFRGNTYAASWDMNSSYSWQCFRGPRP